MLNQVVVVGRLVESPVLNEDLCNITLAVPRSFKNAEGEYETDFVKAELRSSIAKNTCEYCHKGDLICIKGRLESVNNTNILAVEKVSFLSSNGGN